jgi:hypothetical protein
MDLQFLRFYELFGLLVVGIFPTNYGYKIIKTKAHRWYMHTKYIMLDQGQYPINSIGYKVFLDILFPIRYDVVV